jgi:hypothetical protein
VTDQKPAPGRRQAILFVIVLAAAAVAFALPFRQPNCNTSSHYVVVQMIASGHETIDRIHGESCDISWWRGHYFANKAPGLALATTPWYLALHALGVIRPDPLSTASFPRAMRAIPRRDLWLMGLWGAVLPALGLLVLVRSVANQLAPGTGIVASVTLAFATLLLPFSSLFFAHSLSAFLVFAAFALVLDTDGANWRRIGIAGLLMGFGVAVEYPVGLLLLALGAYVAARRPRLARSAVFALAALVGLVPLAAYDVWTFGSPFHLSYIGAVTVPGVTGHDVLGANSAGFFGVAMPHLSRGLQVLFGSRGLLTLGPVVALAPLGWVLFWRAGRRHEAVFLSGVVAIYILYNAAYYSPLGGATPGPRFLIPILPFMVLAVAPVICTWPLSVLVLAIPSAAILLAAHLTQPLISPPYEPGDWWHWLHTDGFSSTVLSPGAHGWLPAVPIALAALLATAAAIASVRSVDRVDLQPALICAFGWLAAFVAFPHLARSFLGAVAIIATLTVVVLASRRGAVGLALTAMTCSAIVVVHRHAAPSAILAVGALATALLVTKWSRLTRPGVLSSRG